MNQNPITVISDHFNQQLIPLMHNIDFIYSPISILIGLLLVYIGSNGRTRQQLKQVLGIKFKDAQLIEYLNDLMANKDVQIGNAMIIKQSYHIKPNYFHQIKQLKAQLIPFQQISEAVNRSNLWVKMQTKGLIPKLLNMSDVNARTRMIIINTIYFKGLWRHQFNPKNTQIAPFTNYQRNQVNCSLMKNSIKIPYYENNQYQMIELPYQSRDFVMGVVLPKNPNFLNQFMTNPSILQIDQIPLEKRRVHLYLPKFTHRQKFEPLDLLKTLGITDLFDNSKSDLSLINDQEPLSISKVIHESVVTVDEDGTQAAAATALMMEVGAAPPQAEKEPVIFKADHSFYYYIRSTFPNLIYFNGIFNG